MARKRIGTAALEDWNGVSCALTNIGEIERKMGAAEITMQQKIERATAELAEEKTRLETQVAAFVEMYRNDLGDKKSKTPYFGTVGYCKSQRIVLPRAATKLAEIVTRLRARGMNDCIVTKPEAVDKEALEKYPARDIEAVGAKFDVKDIFWYEIDKTRLSD